ncbi:hypothetical protein BO94DRAFT_537707 [Aspergillus sclerotioniger CBS 115572]|uniref:Uncharacterized protein n=1 Tax=Aspergillus sclerotioniger CBS 115572 TaxID=1450535 RepID=A0A317VVU4_9EURO|nr:hypothetical protein BO94DRAFT_537707 [Aspergillus sclerotioniger CBS 115572]PWY78516.1 hypothetical protein BO94DRAFT_537707 [Aspergillus sclerotioniger CBS 115572]
MVVDTRQTRRKRRNSSTSSQVPPSPASGKKTRQAEYHTVPASSCETPHQPSKRVRFSDPGPELQHDLDYSTGLTPAMLRTSFEERAEDDPSMRTPSRRLRRRSTPLPRSRRYMGSPNAARVASPGCVVQFTPLRQLLDARTQRRIRRVGLSDEINQLEREKRETARYQKTLQSLLRERDCLKHELESVKRYRTLSQRQLNDEATCLSPQSMVEQVESENTRLMEQLSFPSPGSHGEHDTIVDTEGETMIINDSRWECDTLLVSDSPDFRGLDSGRLLVPDNFSLLSQGRTDADASTQASMPDYKREAEIIALSADLAAARKEKKDLFDACRARVASFEGTAIESLLRRPSPPPDFLDHVLPTLTQTLRHASDAAEALDHIKEELSGLGFPGENANDIISTMRDQFRTARLRLERAIPGETPNAGLSDGNSTLGALVKRVEMLVRSLRNEQVRLDGSLGRENALRGQFNNLLARYEAASKKIRDLEESITTSAGDMLHTRMRMQELENEGKEQTVSIDRLNAALDKYHEEVKGLEALVTALEADKTKINEAHKEMVEELQRKMEGQESAIRSAESTIAERELRIRELEDTVQRNHNRVCDLTTKVESLEVERQQAVQSLANEAAEQQERLEQEVGSMNVRVSELNTSLEEARSDIERLQRSNTGLENQLRLEVEARDSLLDRWAADQARSFAFMKESLNNERRKARVRAANWEVQSDEIHSDSLNFGSEPITPVSMTRYVDVEAGRGKHRKPLDSAIGILTEDDLEDVAVGHIMSESLPSDPADL